MVGFQQQRQLRRRRRQRHYHERPRPHLRWMLVVVVVVAVVALSPSNVMVATAWPNAEVNSREYKTMLRAERFNVAVAAIAEEEEEEGERIMTDILRDLQDDLTRAARAAGATGVRGQFAPKAGTPREVRFYDTPSTCWLRQHGLILRMRRPLLLDIVVDDDVVDDSDDDDDSDDNDDDNDDDGNNNNNNNHDVVAAVWEGMLKSRSGDRYYTTHRKRYMNDCNRPHADKTGSRKLEEDIPQFDWTGNVYSFSQKCFVRLGQEDDNDDEEETSTTTRTTLQWVANVWDKMGEYMESRLQLDLTTPLQRVSNTSMIEVVYEDFWVDLEQRDYDDDSDDDKKKKKKKKKEKKSKEDRMAEAKVTLWYHQDDSLLTALTTKNNNDNQQQQQSLLLLQQLQQTQVPNVAELSFRIKSKHESWSDQTIMTMHAFWEQCAKQLRRQQRPRDNHGNSHTDTITSSNSSSSSNKTTTTTTPTTTTKTKQKNKWLDEQSMTKTAWIYQYDPSFCQPTTTVSEDDSDEDTT